MKRKTIKTLLLASIILIISSSLAFASEYQEGEVIVRFKPSLVRSLSARSSIHAEMGATVEKSFESVDGMQLIKLGQDVSVEEALDYYGQDSSVLYVEPNYKVYAYDDISGQAEGFENIQSVETIEYRETEPNDDMDNANLIDGAYSGDINYDAFGTITEKSLDKDYYRLDISKVGKIEVYGIWGGEYAGSELEEDLVIELFNDKGQAIASSALYDSNGQVFRYMSLGVFPGTYYTVVSQSRGEEGSEYIGEEYMLNIRHDADDEPKFSNLWGLENTGQSIDGKTGIAGADISALDAWDIQTGSSDVLVAVIDSGVDYNNVNLAGNMWTDENGYYGRNFVDSYDDPNDPMDDFGHGTHVSGTIAAVGTDQNEYKGVMWDADIMALKVFGPDGSGSTSDVINAIEFANEHGARVINMSLGGDGYSQAFYDAIAASEAVIVAAAGNAGSDNDALPEYPASFDLDNVISVAATDNMDTLTWFSNYGAESVDVAAPGEGIYSTWINDRYIYAMGTSMAAPHVAGLAGLLFSQDPSLSNLEVVDLIKDNVDCIEGLDGKILTGGRINARASLENAIKYSIEGLVIDKGGEILELDMDEFANKRAAGEFVFDDTGSLILPSYIKSSDGYYYELGDFTSARAASDGSVSGGLKLLHNNLDYIKNVLPGK